MSLSYPNLEHAVDGQQHEVDEDRDAEANSAKINQQPLKLLHLWPVFINCEGISEGGYEEEVEGRAQRETWSVSCNSASERH